MKQTTSELLAAVEDYDAQDFGLFGDNVLRGGETTAMRQKESPMHRMMVLLRAKGSTTKEIARAVGCTAANVQQILRQPWARKRLMTLVMEKGMLGVDKLLEGAIPDSIMTWIEVRDDPDTPPATKIAAAEKIVDRYLGKPTQRVESHVEQVQTPQDIAALQERLAQLKEKEAQLRAN